MYEVIRQIDRDIVLPFDLIISVYSTELATMSHDELLTLMHEQLQKAEVLGGNGVNSDVHGIVSAKEYHG
jgi:hypothetical protein